MRRHHGREQRDLYGDAFYEDYKDAGARSASVVVPMIDELVRPSSVVDIGCGVGSWTKAFAALPAVEDVLGVDGAWVPVTALRMPTEQFFVHDIGASDLADAIGRTFDLAVCLEAAEHLPPERAALLVASLTALAPVVAFSAAIPFQRGEGHVNEQWPSYWADLFAREGFVAVDCLRTAIWDNPDVLWWYAQNLVMFVRESELANYSGLADARASGPVVPARLVHPSLYLDFADPDRWSPGAVLRLLLRQKRRLALSDRTERKSS